MQVPRMQTRKKKMLTASSPPHCHHPRRHQPQLSVARRELTSLREYFIRPPGRSDPLFQEPRDTHFTAHRTSTERSSPGGEERGEEERRKGNRHLCDKVDMIVDTVQGSRLAQEISLAQPLRPMLGPHPNQIQSRTHTRGGA